jgi:hypothetical protein
MTLLEYRYIRINSCFSISNIQTLKFKFDTELMLRNNLMSNEKFNAEQIKTEKSISNFNLYIYIYIYRK